MVIIKLIIKSRGDKKEKMIRQMISIYELSYMRLVSEKWKI